jgi:hypothetical protein
MCLCAVKCLAGLVEKIMPDIYGLIYLVRTHQINEAKNSHWIGQYKICMSPDFAKYFYKSFWKYIHTHTL